MEPPPPRKGGTASRVQGAGKGSEAQPLGFGAGRARERLRPAPGGI